MYVCNAFVSFVEQNPTFKLGLFKHDEDDITASKSNKKFSANINTFNPDQKGQETTSQTVHKPIYLTNNARNLLEEIINGNEDLGSHAPTGSKVNENNKQPSERKQKILEQMQYIDFGNMMEGNYFSL